MKRLRISGLVRFVKGVRQELAGPVSTERLALLRRQIDENIGTIERIARDKGLRVQSLPLPSRKAFQFLKGLDLSAVAATTTSPAGGLPPESVSFRGLQSHFEGLLHQLARSAACPEQDGVYRQIVSSSESIENAIKTQDIRPEQIKRPARQIRGWLAYFSRRENFDEYCDAVRRVEPIFRQACPWPAAKSAAILVHFRPQQGMYRVRARSDAIVVQLPTPMICFDERLLRSVADVAFRRGGERKLALDAAGGEPYRKMAAAMELLGGVVAQTRGIHHDLAASFDRVNADYFNRDMSRPHLVWSRTFATRKFGHYDYAHDTVMVNMTLDGSAVPELAVDFIVYHELLHKQLGIVWQSNRMAAHTPEFRKRERTFRQYDQARAVLKKLACER